MTNRQGRRRRHKRHKARAKRHPIRMWRWEILAREFDRMCEFMAYSCQRGVYRDLEGNFCMARPGQDYIEVVNLPSPPKFYRIPVDVIPQPYFTTTVYRLVRQRQSMLFYEGRNRRTREIPAKMEKVV